MDANYRAAQRQAALNPGDAGALAMLARAVERLGYSLERAQPGYHPDLEQVSSLSEDGLSYSFHLLVAWKHVPTGRVFFAEDSGCSCPSPFENEWLQFNGEVIDTSLTEVTRASTHAFMQAVDNFPATYGERAAFSGKVRDARPYEGEEECD